MKRKNYWKIFKSLFTKKAETTEKFQADIRTKTTLCIVLSLGSLLLTLFNILNKNSVMMWTTVALTTVFALAAIMVGFFKLRTFAQILVALVVCGVFSFYAWIGGNDGFAILWIAIVPLIAMLFLDFALGFGISVYFLLFLIILLYILPKCFGIIPGSDGNGGSYYNQEFMNRFPALYAISFCTSIFISGQRIYYLNKAEENALYDSMTSLKNRRFYTDYVSFLSKKDLDSDLTVVSVDLNNLKVINDIYGHEYGDKAIIETANILVSVFEKYTNKIFRTGGDEFFVFFNDTDNEIETLIKQVNEKASQTKIRDDATLAMSVGYVNSESFNDSGIELLISIAERNMYLNKEEYYKHFHGERRRENRINDSIQKRLNDDK